jgi:hypothetical protein
MNETLDRILTYVIGIISVMSADNWMTLLGFVLIGCKLIQEMPRAWATLKGWFK